MKTSLGLVIQNTASFIGCVSKAPAPTNHAYTLANGSPQRSAIIAGVKEALAKQGMKDLVLQIPYLKVHSGWAWIQVNPQSTNGSQHYESQSGLLQEKAKNWTLLEWMPVEDEMDTKAYFTILRSKYPQVPADIYPK